MTQRKHILQPKTAPLPLYVLSVFPALTLV